VARAIFGNVFENQGSSWKFVDYGIIVEKDRGLNKKVAGIFGFKLFSNGKRRELGPWLMDHGSGQFTMDQRHGHDGELVGAPAPGRFQPRGPNASWGKERGCYGGSILPITEAWEAARRRRTEAVFQLGMAMTRLQKRIGGGELEVWGASLREDLPYIGQR
jgi:hypothetical protein